MPSPSRTVPLQSTTSTSQAVEVGVGRSDFGPDQGQHTALSHMLPVLRGPRVLSLHPYIAGDAPCSALRGALGILCTRYQ